MKNIAWRIVTAKMTGQSNERSLLVMVNSLLRCGYRCTKKPKPLKFMGLFRSIQIMDSLGKASSLIEEYDTLTPGCTTKGFVAISTMQICTRPGN